MTQSHSTKRNALVRAAAGVRAHKAGQRGRRASRCRRSLALGALCLMLSQPARAQQDNPVYVDDSPQARELLRQAKDQTRENVGEAVRIYQQLLDDVALRLTPAHDSSPDHFTSVRRRVLDALRADQALLDRYRLVQTPVAEQLLQEGGQEALQRVAMSYTLTEPGLEALLRVAQRDLESARFYAALSWLAQAETHPDFFGRRAVHAHYMSALAWHNLGRDDLTASHVAALQDLGGDGEAFAQPLQDLLRLNDLPARNAAVSALDHAPSPALDDIVPQAIWTASMDDSLARRRFRSADQSEDLAADALQERLSAGEMATASVTIAGSMAFINQGHTVLALDRLTGRELWPQFQDISQNALTEREGIEALDMNIIAVEGDPPRSLVTLTGHAQPNRRSDRGRIVCLDAADGKRRWSKPLTGVVDAAADEELFPHGAPVILEGTVYVLARKLSTQLLTTAHLVALDLETGDVRWTRHISSSGGLRIAPRPFDSMLLHEGSLYVASPVGAMARIDPATGEMRWLQRFPVPISPPVMDQTRRPWEMTGPVMTSRGLVAIQPDSRRVVLLDRETGDELESHSAGSTGDWNAPRYLLSDGARVFAIGADVRCFNIDNLEMPTWGRPALVTQSPAERAPAAPPSQPQPPIGDNDADQTLDLRGRVQVAGESLIVPTARGVLVLDAVTGALQQTLPIDAAGNPLALDSQLVMALGDRVDAYMSLSRAEQMLRAQMAQAPNDPEPALSLLQIGMRVGNVTLALEAADRAMAAVRAQTDDALRIAGRAELFNLLLEMAKTQRDLDASQGEAVFTRMQEAALGDEQRVEYLLAYGDWLVGRSLPSAIEAWQTILSEPALASSWRKEGDVLRPAPAWAVQRIAALMHSRGTGVYAPQADFAAVRLEQILASPEALAPGGPDAAALLDLAREFPFADAALDATLRASEARLARDDTRGALAALVSIHAAAPRLDSAQRLLGRFVGIAQQAGWTRQAHDALVSIIADFGDIELQATTGGPTPAGPRRRASQWLREIETAHPALTMRRPRLGSPAGDASALAAPVIASAPTVSAGGMPENRALLREGNTVKLVTSNSMEPAWSATVEGASPQVLRLDEQGVLLWFGADPQDPRAVMLDPDDGSVVWTTPSLDDFLTDPGRDLVRIRTPREQMPDGEPFDPAQTLALVQQQALILVRRNGAIVALSAADGRTPLWPPRTQVLEQVHLAEVRDGLLVLAGMAREMEPAERDAARAEADVEQSPGTLVPRIVVLDPLTGQPAFAPDGAIRLTGRAGVKWMNISQLGLLVYGTAAGIDAVDLYTGRRMWFNSGYGTLDTQQAWGLTRRVVFQDQRSRLRSIALDSGIASEPFEQPLRGEWDASELKSLIVEAESIIGHYRQRIVRYDAVSGVITGADSVVDQQRDFRWALLAGDRIVAVSVQSLQAPQAGGTPGRRTQFEYTVHLMSTNGKALGEPYKIEPRLLERIQQVNAIDNWLLLSTLTGTVAVPMPVE